MAVILEAGRNRSTLKRLTQLCLCPEISTSEYTSVQCPVETVECCLLSQVFMVERISRRGQLCTTFHVEIIIHLHIHIQLCNHSVFLDR